MGNKIKKLIYFMKRRAFLLFLVFFLASLLIPSISFGWWGSEWAANTLGSVLMGLLSLIALVFLAIANLWLSLAILLLGWVTSPSFISLSYTGIDNPMIKIGWTLTRDLANMGIVLVLIVIGRLKKLYLF